MKTVLLTKEQAEALESAKRIQTDEGYDLSNIIAWKVNELFSHDEKALNQLELDTLIKALYVGYEVEPGPEEKVAQIYKEAQGFYKKYMAEPSGSFHAGQMEGIRIALDIFGIKVKGVNC